MTPCINSPLRAHQQPVDALGVDREPASFGASILNPDLAILEGDEIDVCRDLQEIVNRPHFADEGRVCT